MVYVSEKSSIAIEWMVRSLITLIAMEWSMVYQILDGKFVFLLFKIVKSIIPSVFGDFSSMQWLEG